MNVNVSCDDLPKEMLSKGLDLDRQWYLFEHIRELCHTDEAKNCICLKPATDKRQKTDCAPIKQKMH
ncbi:hypothetical protein DPMN_047584 [Dreissena polymorpha]|uniref:Uncharacterized protein n=1 Tax=Dreissena polymorpha TaxID=45954 RepID=A0A9D4DA15_DREPO|nr:hypothetical protein DPMN_047584 [Dreissena polymorpha]